MTADNVKACERCGKKRPVNHSRNTRHCMDCLHLARHGVGNWMEHGKCRSTQHDPEWWWPENSNDPTSDLAIFICRYCPVRKLCLDHAIQHQERDGIWGGLMPAQRARVTVLELERRQPPPRDNDTPANIAARRNALFATD